MRISPKAQVVLLNGSKIEGDYENTSFKQLKGNVYLARVTGGAFLAGCLCRIWRQPRKTFCL